MSKIGKPKVERYDAPSGGWGSARSVTEIVLRERVPLKSGACWPGRTSMAASPA